ncbi:MAG: hypothetical protein E7076_09295 [Bacteroidales bacterium]|nr:hypothetical protein [Bacteroidales bacterium]
MELPREVGGIQQHGYGNLRHASKKKDFKSFVNDVWVECMENSDKCLKTADKPKKAGDKKKAAK